MPSPEVLLSFREGLKIIQSANDFATLRHTVDRMISICPPAELHMAKDAIARVVRAKQAVELQNSQGQPQALSALDKKYRDLYIVLRTAQSHVAPAPRPQALPPSAPPSRPPGNQMAKVRSLGGLNMPMMILDWLRTKRKYLIAGGAVGAVGGAYMLYRQLTSDKDDTKKNPEDSNFDKTIKSIQKYKAFSMMMNDPNFSGDYTDIINGNYKKTKKKKELKKEDNAKSIAWDKEERSLMKDMDDAFNSIATKPELAYQLPQLPAPKNIDPKEILGEDKPLEFRAPKSPKIKNRPFSEKKPRKSRKPRKPKEKKPEVVETPAVEPPSEPKIKKTRRKASASEEAPGRLIPIVKRTKRVKKVNA
jgi:hypothetical protein